MVDVNSVTPFEFSFAKSTTVLLLTTAFPDRKRSFAVNSFKTILLLFLRVVLPPACYVVNNPLPILTCPSSVDFESTFSIASIVFSLFPLSFLLVSAVRHFSASFWRWNSVLINRRKFLTNFSPRIPIIGFLPCVRKNWFATSTSWGCVLKKFH